MGKYSRKLHGDKQRLEYQNQRKQLFKLKFSDIHFIYRFRLLRFYHGPIPISDPKQIWLLIRYVGEKTSDISWDIVCMNYGLGFDTLYYHFRYAVLLERSVVRARAISSLECALRMFRLPAVGPRHIMAANSSHSRTVRSTLIIILRRCKHIYPNMTS